MIFSCDIELWFEGFDVSGLTNTGKWNALHALARKENCLSLYLLAHSGGLQVDKIVVFFLGGGLSNWILDITLLKLLGQTFGLVASLL